MEWRGQYAGCFYQMIEEKFGRLDIIAANAGGGDLEPLGEITEESYYNTFDTVDGGIVQI